MKSQDDKEQHKVTCHAILMSKREAFVFDCSCGSQWTQEAIDADPFQSSLVTCECGGRGWFDLRTTRRRALDAGGAP